MLFSQTIALAAPSSVFNQQLVAGCKSFILLTDVFNTLKPFLPQDAQFVLTTKPTKHKFHNITYVTLPLTKW